MLSMSVALIAQEAQQVQEQVNEVQIELEGGEDGGLGQHLRGDGIVVVVDLDLLGVVGGPAQEGGDADETDHRK